MGPDSALGLPDEEEDEEEQSWAWEDVKDKEREDAEEEENSGWTAIGLSFFQRGGSLEWDWGWELGNGEVPTSLPVPLLTQPAIGQDTYFSENSHTASPFFVLSGSSFEVWRHTWSRYMLISLKSNIPDAIFSQIGKCKCFLLHLKIWETPSISRASGLGTTHLDQRVDYTNIGTGIEDFAESRLSVDQLQLVELLVILEHGGNDTFDWGCCGGSCGGEGGTEALLTTSFLTRASLSLTISLSSAITWRSSGRLSLFLNFSSVPSNLWEMLVCWFKDIGMKFIRRLVRINTKNPFTFTRGNREDKDASDSQYLQSGDFVP